MTSIIRAGLWALFGVFFITNPVEAQQNLVVQPMRVEADIPANRTAQIVLTIRNRNEARVEPLNLELVDITQSSDGTLQIVTEELREGMDPERLRASSRDWVELPATRIEVGPGETAEVPVRLRPPPDARGAFVSAVRITTDAPDAPALESDGPQAFFAIRFGFLVPLITPIQGRPVRQNITMSDIEMVFDDGRAEDGSQASQPTTRAYMGIVNDGHTYSNLRGEITIERRMGANWRTVTRAALPERRILPGITLRLPVNLDRRLPSGEYRLLGNLSVDGRRLPRIERLVEFEGDPDADAVAFDTVLNMEPPLLGLEGVPGAARANTVAIGNPGEQPLTVTFTVETPESLKGVAMGEVAGDDLSAAPWTEIRPAELTLRPGQVRNVRVMSRMPREDMVHAHYYADIVLSGRYEDGQSAGETRSRLTLRQQQIDLSPMAILDRMSIALDDDDSAYIVQTRLVNTGNTDIAPQIRAELINATGNVVDRWDLTGEAGRLLPLGIRDYAGSISVASVAEGNYILRVLAGNEGDRLAERQMPVRIDITGDEDEPVAELTAIEN